MKNLRMCLLFVTILSLTKVTAQASFSLAPSLCAGATTSVSVNTGTLSAIAYSWAALPAGPVFSSPSSASTTIYFPTAGVYTIGAGFFTGTAYSYTFNIITINPSPTVSASASNVTLCTGQSATLTASGATTYSWGPSGSLNTTSGTSVIASPLSSTVYSVTGSIGACSASISVPLTVINFAPGSVSITPSQSAICAGFMATLTAFGASNYTWTGSNLTTPLYQQSVTAGPGTYTVVGASGGCSASASTNDWIKPSFSDHCYAIESYYLYYK